MKHTIFLVEDNEDSRFLLTQALISAGYEVHAAATMREALSEFGKSHAEILISDISLPDGSGNELLLALQRQGEAPYAIAVSGLGTAADIATARASGFRAHLIKPFEIAALERLVAAASHEIDGA